MNDLLKEAIADAKAVKEVALANAKLALEEAFTPRLQSMLSKKLAEEAEAEEPVEEGEGEEESAPVEEDYGNDWFEEEPGSMSEAEDEEAPVEEGEDEEAPVEEGEDEEPAKEEPAMEEGEDEEEPMDEELMEIIRQLEEDIDSSEIGSGDNKKPSAVASDDSTEDKSEKLVQLVEEEDEDSEEVAEIKEILRALREEEEAEAKKEAPVEEGEDEEEVDIKEVLRALREEEEESEKVEEAEEAEKEKEVAESKLREAYAVITFLRSKINEVNLLNSKLLFSNKLFRKHSLNEKQKMTVIENFDRASSLREVKLVYATLSESLRTTKVKQIKESFASKPTASTRPSKPILNEGDVMANRLRKLAGLK
jgi:hypothetical protein